MILFTNQRIDSLKHLYLFLLIVASFVVAVKIPQFHFESHFIAIFLTILIAGLIPLKIDEEFDISLISGFAFVALLKYGFEKSFIPLIIIVFLAYFFKIYKNSTIKRTSYNAFFNTLFLVLSNSLGLFLFELMNKVLPANLSLVFAWIFVIASDFALVWKYLKTKSRNDMLFFISISSFTYIIAFISFYILFAYDLLFYTIYSFSVILFFVYLHLIQVNEKFVVTLTESLNKLKEIRIEGESSSVKELLKNLYYSISRYLHLICVGINEIMDKEENNYLYCTKAEQKGLINKHLDIKKIKESQIYKFRYGNNKLFVLSYKLNPVINRTIYNYYITDDYYGLKENTVFFNLLKNKIEVITENINLYGKAKEEFVKTIEMIISIIEAKDKLTAGHSIRVAKYAYLIGKELGLNKKELDDLKFAALFHDIGKIAIPEDILNKTTELTENEFEIIKKHPKIGADLVKNIDYLKDSVPGIIEHHERYDGTGYPKELKEKEISLQGRIIAVADAFDAVTSNRVYRYPIKRIDAIAMIIAGSYSRFDPEIVEIFVEIIKRYNEEYISEKMIEDLKI